jgi:hypothetical protein
VEFSPELRDGVLGGDVSVSIRLWKTPRVRQGRRYRVGVGQVEIDGIELIRFEEVSTQDVRRSGERDLAALRLRAAHSGPIDDDTLVYRVVFHAVRSDEP